MNAVVEIGEIPYTDVQLEGITAGATSLRSVASAVRDGTADIVTAWSAISGSYEGPSDQELFDVMTPIGPQGTTFGDDLDSAAKALDAFVEEATPIVAALKAYVARAEQLQRDVAAFQPQTIQTMDGPVTQTESWDQDETLNGENNDIINGVANRVVEYQAAERKCANAIRSLSGLPAMHAITGSGDDALGYGYDELPMGTKLPWGTAESRNESCAEKTTWFLPRLVKGVVWDGAIVGTIGGLGELLGFRDWKWSGDNFVDTWKSLGSLIGYDKESNEWFDGDAAKAGWGGLLKGTVAWDKWADDPGTALGESAWNIASLVIPVVGVASKVSTVGRAGEVASAISKAGKVLDLVDAGAWASRGLTKVLPKLGDLKGVLTDGFEHVPDGFRTRIAEFRVDLDEWRHGTHADADGAVDGPAARSEGAADAAADAHAQANANAHAHSEGAQSNVPTPEREPALVGGGHGESATVHGGGSDAGSSGGSGHGAGVEGDPGHRGGDGPTTGGAGSEGQHDGSHGGDRPAPPAGGGDNPPPETRPVPRPDTFDPTRGDQYASGDPLRPGEPTPHVPRETYDQATHQSGWKYFGRADRPWADYQAQIAGVERTVDGKLPEYRLFAEDGTTVDFDGMTERGHPPQEVFLDAKAFSRGIAFADPAGPYWSKRIPKMIEQAEDQLAALPDGARLEWHVSDPYAADAVRRLLRGGGIDGDDLTVIFTPMRTE